MWELYKCFSHLIKCSKKDVKDDLNDQNKMTKFHIEMEKRSYIYIYKGILNKTVGNGLVMTHI